MPFFRCTGHSLQLLSDELGPLWWRLAEIPVEGNGKGDGPPSHDGTHIPQKKIGEGVISENFQQLLDVVLGTVFGIIHKHSHPEKRKKERPKKKRHTQ